MKYIGIDKQISRNNFNSILLLIAFPALLLGMCYAVTWFAVSKSNVESAPYNNNQDVNTAFLSVAPFVLAFAGIWFLIAWTGHSTFIRLATNSKPLDRIENKRVYNLVENLCITQGMTMPKVFIIEDDSLNAFASGIDQRSYNVTLSRGIINKLNDEELESVIAHELTHIRNRDTRVLIVSIIFVGIFAFLAEMAFRSLRFAGGGKSKDSKGKGAIILLAVVVTAVCYLISILLRFGISRSREYLADAGSAEMTHKPYALANALKKIEEDPYIEAVENRDVAQLFISNPKPSKHGFSWDNLFATHPPIEKRIQLLEQFV